MQEVKELETLRPKPEAEDDYAHGTSRTRVMNLQGGEVRSTAAERSPTKRPALMLGR